MKKIIIVGILLIEIVLINNWIFKIIKPDPSVAIGLILFVPMLLGINLILALVFYFVKKKLSKLFVFNAVFCSLVFCLYWNGWYDGYDERNNTEYKFSINDIVYELSIGKNTEYFYLCDENNNGRVYVGKYKRKGDSLILKDNEAEMYVIGNKLFGFPEKTTEINLSKTE